MVVQGTVADERRREVRCRVAPTDLVVEWEFDYGSGLEIFKTPKSTQSGDESAVEVTLSKLVNPRDWVSWEEDQPVTVTARAAGFAGLEDSATVTAVKFTRGSKHGFPVTAYGSEDLQVGLMMYVGDSVGSHPKTYIYSDWTKSVGGTFDVAARASLNEAVGATAGNNLNEFHNDELEMSYKSVLDRGDGEYAIDGGVKFSSEVRLVVDYNGVGDDASFALLAAAFGTAGGSPVSLEPGSLLELEYNGHPAISHTSGSFTFGTSFTGTATGNYVHTWTEGIGDVDLKKPGSDNVPVAGGDARTKHVALSNISRTMDVRAGVQAEAKQVDDGEFALVSEAGVSRGGSRRARRETEILAGLLGAARLSNGPPRGGQAGTAAVDPRLGPSPVTRSLQDSA